MDPTVPPAAPPVTLAEAIAGWLPRAAPAATSPTPRPGCSRSRAARWRGEEKRASAPTAPARQSPAVLAAALKHRLAAPHEPGGSFMVGLVIDHPRFGPGLALALIEPHELSARVLDQTRVLVHRRRAWRW